MQQFDDKKGVRRCLNIQRMQEGEVEDYYCQFLRMKQDVKVQKTNQLKEKIKNNSAFEWILAIKSKDQKIIGKIEVLSMGPDTAFLTINIPNESKRWKYGEEAIKQFLKICKESHYFSTIELDSRDEIIDSYVNEYKTGYIIKVA